MKSHQRGVAPTAAPAAAQRHDARPAALAHLPEALWRMALPARQRQRLPKPALESLILALCAGQWLSARELGALLNRQSDKLQTRVLTGLVSSGRLQLRYPGVPNRPDQAYRSADLMP